jgi:hypothetical protein
MLAGWTYAVLLAGCGSEPGINVSEVVTGIYRFKSTIQADNCTPHRFAGERGVSVVSSGAGEISLWEASGFSLQAYVLKATDNYSQQTPREGEQINPCPGVAGDTYFKSDTLLMANHARIEVADIEDWTVTTSCSPARVGASAVPISSCRSERTFVYELQAECKSPCSIKSATNPLPGELAELSCVCSSP